ncbi:MAG: alcohol dehydrogenase catalytic domain-containing protein [Patescibacteria group bacterium]|nr:alcohol dehydrogenase catalytic domain-containing protein [Patescibacteria group bacterium]
MKALIFDKSKYGWETSRGFELADVPEPVLEEGDEDKIIIKVAYAGVCGTDKGIWHRQAFKDAILNSIDAESKNGVIASPSASEGEAILTQEKTASDYAKATSDRSLPDKALAPRNDSKKTYRIIGHEFFGEIVKVGSNVKNLKPGDFVACESHVVCNKCYQCLYGQKNVCTNEKILGISVDGGFAEFAKVPAQVAWKTDTGRIRPEVAAMQEPFGNAVHAASKVDLKGKTVAIFGLGPIGMFLTLIAKGLGASTIIGIEPNPVAIDMAKKLGIDYVITLKQSSGVIARSASDQRSSEASAKEDEAILPDKKIASDALAMTQKPYAHNQAVVDEILKITNGLGADVAFEMAGFNDSVNNAIASVRRGGDVILFGLKNGDFVFEDYNRLVMKGVTMHCVAGRQIWETWEITKKLMEDLPNGVQEKLFDIILDRGQGAILPIAKYTKEGFEEMMSAHPKFLIQF